MKIRLRIAVAFFVAVLFVFASCSKKSNEARTPNPRTDFSYELNEAGDGIIITSYIGTTKTSVIIPDTIEDYPVAEIGDDVFSWSSYEYVYIPRTVTRVGARAFFDIKKLDIDLTKITSITPYAPYPFDDGTGIGATFKKTNFTNTDITIPSTWETNFKSPDEMSNIFAETNITSVTFSDGWKVIPKYMFKTCSELKSVTFPASLKEIRYQAFLDCSKLESVNFAEGATIKYYGVYGDDFSSNNSFTKCTALTLGVKSKIKATGYKDGF